MGVLYEWDEQKRLQTIRQRGVDFAQMAGFDWNTAAIIVDNRKPYGEKRYNAYGLIGKRLYAVTFTLRNSKIRIISMRKANKKEVVVYERY
jgi:uncharacterized DUF497 family protein